MRTFPRLIALALSTAFLSCCSGGGKLSCNYSAADISTLEGEHTVLAGFAARKGLSSGLHTPLRTHCLVVSDGTGKVCIISNDLMEISPDLSLEWRREISEKSGLPLDRIFMHCIHTHSAPRSGGDSAEEGGSNWNHKQRLHEVLVENAVRTITDDASFRPFRMETGSAWTGINGNRCEKEGPVDREVKVVRFFTKGSKEPLVSIVNLACHPVCMGPGSLLVGADYPGVTGKILSDRWGGDVFQLTGAAGNMDPAEGPKDHAYAERTGRSLADSLLAIKFRKVEADGTLRVAKDTVMLPYRIARITPEAVASHADSLAESARTSFPRFASDVQGWRDQILERIAEGKVSDSLPFELGAVNIGGVVFFFTQGEPFCEYQMEARESFPGVELIFAGYTNGQNSYLPSAHAFEKHVGYEYEIDQMHVYIKAPYPLSSSMPAVYADAVESTIEKVI